jgi:glycerol-3-phosphate dehydrogenase
MAEDVIDRAARVAGLEPRPSRTAELRLRGSTGEPCDDARLAPYGADAAALGALERSSPELAERLDPEGRVSAAQVVWAVRYEMARTVEDVLARRTRLLILGAGASLAAAPAVARRIARERGLDEAWERQAVEEYRSIAVRYVP